MDQDLASQVDAFVRGYLMPAGWKLAGAFVVWLAGVIQHHSAAFERGLRGRVMTLKTFNARHLK